LKPHLRKQWCIAEINAEFIWRMEKVLRVYEQPYNPRKPVVCFDERPCQLRGDVLMPIPMKPGRVERQDYHYQRHGTCVVLMAVEPLAGWRMIAITKRKTKKDYAFFMKRLVAEHYRQAEEIILVQDNLNTHNPSSFYEAFPAPQASDLAERFAMVYTPKKASWLNMAEIELSALSKQCLDRRISNRQTLSKEVSAWVEERNSNRATINWQFTNSHARDKLQRFYNTIRY
jgi:hypothetical protein